MRLSGILAPFQPDSPYAAGSRNRVHEGQHVRQGGGNTGADTAIISSEAVGRYHAMANGSAPAAAPHEADRSLFVENGLPTLYTAKGKRMDNAELLAFLQSDGFAANAMGYARGVVLHNVSAAEDEGTPDRLAGGLSEAGEADEAEGAQNAASVAGQGEKQEGKAYVNGKHSSEEELAVAIHELEEEVRELTAVYEQIMNGEGSDEEKIRLSQPVHKRLEERMRDLHDLKAQAQGLADEKNLAQRA